MPESTAKKGENEAKTHTKKTYPEGNWVRKTSYGMGEYLKMEDEMSTFIRGGKRIRMVKNVSFHVPIIPIGELDEYGKNLLDAMLAGKRDKINDIVNFFKNYRPQPGLKFNKKAFQEAQQAEIDKEKEDEMKLLQDTMKETMMNMMKRANENVEDLEEGYVFDRDDPDFKKIPIMHPNTKKHTFVDWFDILYSVCDPKRLTDEQCVEVLEIVMGGSYLKELKDMEAKKFPLNKIEKHFLKKDIISDPEYQFNKNDPEFQKIPFMHPDQMDHTFEESFEILYSVCDPKDLSDAQCTDVMEVRMGGSYLEELKEFKDRNSDLEDIEVHFLSKDIQGNGKKRQVKVDRYTRVKSSCKDVEKPDDKSYYRHITGLYKPCNPELNRTLRSDSVERQESVLDTDHFARSSSVLSTLSNFPGRLSCSPSKDRAMSVPRAVSFSDQSHSSYSDSKVCDYLASLDREATAKSLVSRNRWERSENNAYQPGDRFSSRYNSYGDILGCWKHYNLSADTINFRNMRARSPIISRELDKYINRNQNPDFRHYNYRPVPKLGR